MTARKSYKRADSAVATARAPGLLSVHPVPHCGWIDHLRIGNSALAALLNKTRVSTHPFVIGELACGNLRNRDEVLELLNGLPQAPIASQAEVLFFIERNELMAGASAL